MSKSKSNKDNIKKLNGIQYRALKISFKAPLGASSTELHTHALNRISFICLKVLRIILERFVLKNLS